MKKTFNLLLLLGIAILLTGCNQNIRVGGKVTFSDNKEPLTAGMVSFETDTFQARGKIEPDGTYKLGMLEDGDGLPAGTYRVFIMGAVVGDPRRPANAEYPSPPLPLIDAKYETGATSGLTYTVDRANREFNFDVDPNLQTRRILASQSK